MIQMLSKFVKSLDVNKLGFSSYANESDTEASFLNLSFVNIEWFCLDLNL